MMLKMVSKQFSKKISIMSITKELEPVPWSPFLTLISLLLQIQEIHKVFYLVVIIQSKPIQGLMLVNLKSRKG